MGNTPADQGRRAAQREKMYVSDENNPTFAFRLTSTQLLIDLLHPHCDVQSLIKKELMHRGVQRPQWL